MDSSFLLMQKNANVYLGAVSHAGKIEEGHVQHLLYFLTEMECRLAGT